MSLPLIPVLASGDGAHAAVHEFGLHGWLGWVILFLPLAAAAAVLLFPVLQRRGKAAGLLSIGAIAACFLITFFGFFVPAMTGAESMTQDGAYVTHQAIVNWIDSDTMVLGFGTRMDQLALTMTLVVTAVGLAIFVYALGYMHGDASMGRFYGKFSLFVFSMLGIVVSPNFFQTFVFWELVGASSYFLIGYYWKKHSAGEAAKKAFMTNRVGDFMFLLGILGVWAAVGQLTGVLDMEKFGALDFGVIANALGEFGAVGVFGSVAVASIVGFLVFGGAMGKSAQFPLHVWLPDAMEGPTPVSALMHAATMVAAGVYMVTRCFFIYDLEGSWAATAVAWIGTITAFTAATMALTQRDIKKVLAYSTLSQLGYMTMALGAGAYTAAMFHLTTHAFFKALLFLCAGSAITGCHHEQDIFKMGGLRTRMKSTSTTFLIGMLALCGIFPFAGFWSKDEILGSMSHAGISGHTLLFWVGVITAGLTSFYMMRVWVVAFLGKYRGEHEPHESPKVMTWPLWSLAFFAVVIGFVGIPGHENNFEGFLHAWHVGDASEFHMPVAVISTIVAVAGLVLGFVVYRRAQPGTDPLPKALGPVWTLWNRLYYIDDLYTWLVKKVQDGIAWLAWLFERWVIIGTVVNGTAFAVTWTSDKVRRVQNGKVSAYVTAFALGVVVLVALVFLSSCTG